MHDLRDKNAFVTGAASGIGRAIAESLARRGAAIAVADIDADGATRAAAEIQASGGRALAVACDVTDATSLARAGARMAAELGEVHVLVNNAGAFAAGPLEQTTRNDWEWLIEVNVLGVVNGLQTFLPRMRAHGGEAHVLNTASVSGHLAVPGLSIYTATKFAVVGLSECLRQELAETPIGVSVLCPGIVRTTLLETSRRHRPDRHADAGFDATPSIRGVIDGGTDAAELGERAVEAILADEFYVFTHPALRPALEARFAEILGAYPTS